ncbi:uracil-DNA glycosylase [Agrobacterium vitis]|uniref:Type-4 uracil-DNA glycosylase n=1 Tax=Agrobacterium vitis TaxID=373 RepID=A0A368NTS8_AGRVI|nr:uracil-DNA glycosylase [Agrobacterium vitis]KAA3519615.1 uracil-DNA glycosylase [Agrobacterium vitis]KAA3532173.1 uracil-DNA glycosylase [Agrobacterium vitis]MCF1451241.1 uracil-DNA glycosylase [Agrobacterium vitis]MCF1475755.1 uracil-DNA glycosylase [Agrobacterium vitis]MUZ71337.1 uracil-DNA glycosylase [Agrobacterium vitis]
MIAAQDMTAAELAALLAFHAEAGVDWLVEDAPVDRIAQFAAERQARTRAAPQQAPVQGQDQRTATAPVGSQNGPALNRDRPAPRPAASTPLAIPDETAINDARFAAESARSLAELKAALEGFSSCNLKTSARSTIFAEGPAEAGIMVIGPIPSADDDREGLAFSGRTGALLDRMLAAIGLGRDALLLTTAIPWRGPGDRMPTPAEAAICRPFIERQIALAEPKAVLLLGNFTARFFFGGTSTIHSMRGEWRDVAAGGHGVAAMATFHPQELLQAPATKALAWRDLLAFRQRLV